MPLSAWLQSFGFHALANPARWATVMAKADDFEESFGRHAIELAEGILAKLEDDNERTVMRDVVIELRRRALKAG
jgi:hypothetical protein